MMWMNLTNSARSQNQESTHWTFHLHRIPKLAGLMHAVGGQEGGPSWGRGQRLGGRVRGASGCW